jgi:hypothetical protein
MGWDGMDGMGWEREGHLDVEKRGECEESVPGVQEGGERCERMVGQWIARVINSTTDKKQSLSQNQMRSRVSQETVSKKQNICRGYDA